MCSTGTLLKLDRKFPFREFILLTRVFCFLTYLTLIIFLMDSFHLIPAILILLLIPLILAV